MKIGERIRKNLKDVILVMVRKIIETTEIPRRAILYMRLKYAAIILNILIYLMIFFFFYGSF
jgi:hypothetical protein